MAAVTWGNDLDPMRASAARRAIGTAGLAAAVALAGPFLPGRLPLCPTRALLHLDCPACGATRGLAALAHGDLAAALSHNLLLVAAVPLALVAWVGWIRTALGHPPVALSLPRWALPVLVAVLVTFTVVRNLALPGLIWLDSQ